MKTLSKAQQLGRLGIVTFMVKDLAAARDFYVNRLGLRVERERHGDFVMVDAGSVRLCLDRTTPDDPARGGGANLILRVESLDETTKELERRSIVFERCDGRRRSCLEVRDPEGYKLIFTERF